MCVAFTGLVGIIQTAVAGVFALAAAGLGIALSTFLRPG